MSELTDRFDALRERLERAVLRAGRAPGSVALAAVSKTYGAAAVAELVRHQRARSSGALCGERAIFGESYMQEATAKMAQVAELLAHDNAGGAGEAACSPPPGMRAPDLERRRCPAAGSGRSPETSPLPGPHCIRRSSEAHPLPGWHFIGGLQRRKAGDAVGRFELIHSLDSLKLAVALQKAWEKQAAAVPSGAYGTEFAPQDVLVQVNVGRETQKSGVDPDELENLLNAVAAMRGLRVRGLMCVPPAAQESGASRPWFILLRRLRDEMEKRCGPALPVLSMGMSDDFEEAVEEGATLVRVGSLIFGPRQRPGG
ncbi:MAG: YggS family pyridoxal phosphate-dependent enzyme [Desulfovibrio sp.]|nr:YggS family pyridoxal phosphate-dependent enzyme [Desulfovibrio sp.]